MPRLRGNGCVERGQLVGGRSLLDPGDIDDPGLGNWPEDQTHLEQGQIARTPSEISQGCLDQAGQAVSVRSSGCVSDSGLTRRGALRRGSSGASPNVSCTAGSTKG